MTGMDDEGEAFLEWMGSCRAIRRLAPDPIPKATLERLVWAATRASNPGNSQGWGFVVLTDPERKARLGASIQAAMGPMLAQVDAMPAGPEKVMMTNAGHLVAHFAEVPAFIIVAARNVYPPAAPNERFVWSTVYPAAQNLILAARAMGLGSAFTTFHMTCEADFRRELAIPDDVYLGATVALGKPLMQFGPVRRKPVEEVLHWEQWSE